MARSQPFDAYYYKQLIRETQEEICPEPGIHRLTIRRYHYKLYIAEVLLCTARVEVPGDSPGADFNAMGTKYRGRIVAIEDRNSNDLLQHERGSQ